MAMSTGTNQAIASSDALNLVNRLKESRSPYVRGHMNNPVAWQTWSPETIELARKSNRLLFLSIGYAACHWCHVMERESFENREVAKLLNQHFVPVKIDREERPDVDRIYMNYVQATTGSGGWPLNVFITPTLQPIFGGTYFPGPGSTSQIPGHAGFIDILERIRDVWQSQQQRCLDSAKEITEQLRRFAEEGTVSHTGGTEPEGLDLELLEESYEHYAKRFDQQYAGFGGAPKFPTPSNLSFLLRLSQFPQAVEDIVGSEECVNAKEMVIKTLLAMCRGGIHDHLGHGFARYSVTRDWSLPHFEKMLYDQAQLLSVYLDAYIITKDPRLLDVVIDVATYLTSAPLCSPTGGFFSAEDADSYCQPNDAVKREGAFYVWTRKELRDILGERDGEICARYFNVRENGNVSPEHDAHDDLINQNVLAITTTPDIIGKEFGLLTEDVKKILTEGMSKLRDHRDKERPRPALDDKIVVGWNGLAIGALARASSILEAENPQNPGPPEWLKAAQKAAAFIKEQLHDQSTGLMKRVYREGPGDAPAFADDYAFLISGLIDLYEATFDDSFIQWAQKLQAIQISEFWDPTSHGFFSTSADAPDLLLRLKDGLDNAEPSTNGISASNLYRLSSIFNNDDYAMRARQTVAAFEAEIDQHPFLFTSMMSSVVALHLGVRSVVVCGKQDAETWSAVQKWRQRLGGLGSLVRLDGTRGEWLRSQNELLQSMDPSVKRVMVCENGACREELDMADIERVLRDMK